MRRQPGQQGLQPGDNVPAFLPQFWYKTTGPEGTEIKGENQQIANS